MDVCDHESGMSPYYEGATRQERGQERVRTERVERALPRDVDTWEDFAAMRRACRSRRRTRPSGLPADVGHLDLGQAGCRGRAQLRVADLAHRPDPADRRGNLRIGGA